MAFLRETFVLVVTTSVVCKIFCEVTVTPVILKNDRNDSVIVSSEPVISIKNTTKLFSDRYSRFLSIPQNQFAGQLKTFNNKNDIDDEKKYTADSEDTSSLLYGIYTDCLFKLSFPCVQRKLLVFLDRLSRLKSFNIFGDILSVVRTKRDMGPVIKEIDLEARLHPDEASSALSALIEHYLERFVRQHVLRITLPEGITASVSRDALSPPENSSGNTIDINVNHILQETSGRGKSDKKMKKLMGMLMTGLMGKMAFMGPFMVLMIKLKAIKALMLSKLALMLSLFHMFKGGHKKGSSHGKEVIIVHDTHTAGSSHDNYGISGWTSDGGWTGGGGGWFGAAGDSYSAGTNSGSNDASYAGSDVYATGTHSTGWTNGGGSHGWGRRSDSDPHWIAYKTYIPNQEE